MGLKVIPFDSAGFDSSPSSPSWLRSEDIKTGVLLYRVVQVLERLGLNPPGFSAAPKTLGQRSQNTRRALSVLSKNKKMSQTVLSIEEDLVRGRCDVFVDLLVKLRKVYSNFKI